MKNSKEQAAAARVELSLLLSDPFPPYQHEICPSCEGEFCRVVNQLGALF